MPGVCRLPAAAAAALLVLLRPEETLAAVVREGETSIFSCAVEAAEVEGMLLAPVAVPTHLFEGH